MFRCRPLELTSGRWKNELGDFGELGEFREDSDLVLELQKACPDALFEYPFVVPPSGG
jgi:hypothetical protein